jgi:chromate transporter
MLLPGPEAQQLATYLGWLLHGVRGGLVAGLLFVLPGAVVMLALSTVYVTFGTVPFVAALFFGLKAAVLVLVIEALLRVAKRALRDRAQVFLAAAAFVLLFFLRFPFPLVVLGAGVLGYISVRNGWGWFTISGHGAAKDTRPGALDLAIAADPGLIARQAPAARRAGWLALAAWLVPVALLTPAGTYGDLARFFSVMAVLTFGGAYAVLAWVAQTAVEGYGWLTADQMLVGLGLAETTPGPVILVLQFVGFLAGNGADGVAGGVLGSLVVLWVTFAPSFVWIFLFAPAVERVRADPALSAALAAITAAVVGVVLNLALWFGLNVLFAQSVPVRFGPIAFDAPVLTSLDWRVALIAVLAGILLLGLKRGVGVTLAAAAGAGLVLSWV